jgi:hypothetical protein
MDYVKVYNQIIERARNRDLKGYSEKHHIIPRCLGGLDVKENLVRLTYREHFVCHKLLCKMYPHDLKIKYAISLMTYGSNNNQRVVRAKDFEYVKTLMSPHFGKWNSGMVCGVDLRTGENVRVSMEEFENNNFLVHYNNKRNPNRNKQLFETDNPGAKSGKFPITNDLVTKKLKTKEDVEIFMMSNQGWRRGYKTK